MSKENIKREFPIDVCLGWYTFKVILSHDCKQFFETYIQPGFEALMVISTASKNTLKLTLGTTTCLWVMHRFYLYLNRFKRPRQASGLLNLLLLQCPLKTLYQFQKTQIRRALQNIKPQVPLETICNLILGETTMWWWPWNSTIGVDDADWDIVIEIITNNLLEPNIRQPTTSKLQYQTYLKAYNHLVIVMNETTNLQCQLVFECCAYLMLMIIEKVDDGRARGGPHFVLNHACLEKLSVLQSTLVSGKMVIHRYKTQAKKCCKHEL
jgi:hypothetical protein